MLSVSSQPYPDFNDGLVEVITHHKINACDY